MYDVYICSFIEEADDGAHGRKVKSIVQNFFRVNFVMKTPSEFFLKVQIFQHQLYSLLWFTLGADQLAGNLLKIIRCSVHFSQTGMSCVQIIVLICAFTVGVGLCGNVHRPQSYSFLLYVVWTLSIISVTRPCTISAQFSWQAQYSLASAIPMYSGLRKKIHRGHHANFCNESCASFSSRVVVCQWASPYNVIVSNCNKESCIRCVQLEIKSDGL